ncbi:MAG: aminotransferase class I/II-fold pyridoxal phosphate-dependent enzyme, partial [Paramuribaculum sp.]|nr:aminotransferase class I/II-fold pyridoxal phosphate-dependent enzyme [Paramuribaculum sp.]
SHYMSGWRVAMLASNPQFVNWILKVKSNIDSGMFKPIMLAAVKALQSGKEWYDELNEVYSERRKVAEEIATSLGCSFDSNQKGLFLWAKVPDDCQSGEKLADDALYKARVFITPGFIFGSNGERYIRISLCANKENMLRALDRLKDAEITKE